MDPLMIDRKLKDQIIKLKIEEGRTARSLADEFGIPQTTIYTWVKAYKKKAATDAKFAKELADMEELQKLKKENAELKKEVDFLKQAAAFFAKEVHLN